MDEEFLSEDKSHCVFSCYMCERGWFCRLTNENCKGISECETLKPIAELLNERKEKNERKNSKL